ncbi:hypothetical protein ACFUIT_10615 [Streptomyces sp. NPDC057239]
MTRLTTQEIAPPPPSDRQDFSMSSSTTRSFLQQRFRQDSTASSGECG